MTREWVTKKDLIEEELPLAKNDLVDFTRRHPEVFRRFREETAQKEKSLENTDIGANVSLEDVVNFLIEELQATDAGGDEAHSYHRLILGVLELIFYPQLINPIKEREINQGRKRVDITFDNGAARDGFFYRLQHTMQIPCQYIFIECKNYSRDINNPEVDQMIGRFSVNAGRFGIIVCRTVENMSALIARCRDTYLAGNGLIVPFTDEDIIQILRRKVQMGEGSQPADEILSNRARDIML